MRHADSGLIDCRIRDASQSASLARGEISRPPLPPRVALRLRLLTTLAVASAQLYYVVVHRWFSTGGVSVPTCLPYHKAVT